jgi:DNA repair protein RadA
MQPEDNPIISKEIEKTFAQLKPRLVKAGFKTIVSLACRDPKELAEVVGIDVQAAASISNAANAKLLKKKQSSQQNVSNTTSFITTAAQQLNQQESSAVVEHISTGSTNLDLFGGVGIEVGAVIQFYSEAGSGKTQLCHRLCTMLPLQYNAIQCRCTNLL